jgi:hypothetical protein
MNFLGFLFLLSATIAWSRAIELPISEGEVKILYPCAVLEELSLKEGESFLVTFYEKNERDLREKGLILRERQFDTESDLTLKYRTSGEISVDEELYLTLKDSGDLKCEADVTYDPVLPKVVHSCSLKTFDKARQEEFLRMLNLSSLSFTNLRKVQVKAQRWKLKIEGLKKKASVEMWQFRNQCLLEVSAKLKESTEALEVFKILKDAIPSKPSLTQSSKTSRVLDQK